MQPRALAGSYHNGRLKRVQDSNQVEPGKFYKDVWLYSVGYIESVSDLCWAEMVWDLPIEKVLRYRAHSEGEFKDIKEREILVVNTR